MRHHDHVAQSIKEVIDVEHEDEMSMTRSDVLARAVTNLCGTWHTSGYMWRGSGYGLS